MWAKPLKSNTVDNVLLSKNLSIQWRGDKKKKPWEKVGILDKKEELKVKKKKKSKEKIQKKIRLKT